MNTSTINSIRNHSGGQSQSIGSETFGDVIAALGWEPATVRLDSSERPRPHLIEKPWVVCVDDDADFSEGLKIRLQSRGYEVVHAHRGMDGLRYAFEFNPVAILLDLCMPGISGQQVLERLKSNESTRDIPVIIMTGLNQPGLKNQMVFSLVRQTSSANLFHLTCWSKWCVTMLTSNHRAEYEPQEPYDWSSFLALESIFAPTE